MSAPAASAPLFNLRVVAGLIAAGVVAFASFMVLAAYAGDFRSGRDGREHALSVAAVGFKGLVDLVEYSGGGAAMLRSEADLDTEDLVVVAIDERTDEDALAAMVKRREAKPTLLILPKWLTVNHQSVPGWVNSAGLRGPRYIERGLAKVEPVTIERWEGGGKAKGAVWLEGIELPAPAIAQTISSPGSTALVSTPDGKALLAQFPGGPLYVLADPDLMNNQGLKDPRRAEAALQILNALNSTGAETVSFDLTLNGFGRKASVLRLAFEPPFLALTLALFVAALLAGLHGAFRFGPERHEERAIAFGKAALVENSAGLFRSARREHRAAGAYADLVAEEAARGAGAPANLRGEELEEYLDRLAPAGAARFSELARRARNAANRDELLRAARALFYWKKDLTS